MPVFIFSETTNLICRHNAGEKKMTDAEQREAARQFVNRWKNGGDEKQDCHPYWLGLLQNVLGVNNAIDIPYNPDSVEI